MPALQLMLLDLAPERRGMVSSCQGFVQSLANGLAAGLLVPLVWGSLGGLAATSAAVMVAGAALLGLQRLSSPAAVR
jgi:DHA1 family bicyclomycin/chloramphenicol resistance-like MFS transporter